MIQGETDLGVTKGARLGNPFLYAQRLFIVLFNSIFSQEGLTEYGYVSEGKEVKQSGKLPFRVYCNPDGSVDELKSSIVISSAYNEEKTANARPQIIVTRNTASWSDQAIGDQGQGHTFGNYNPLVVRARADRIVVPILIEVYSTKDIEAEEIAWLVSTFIKVHETEIKKASLIFKIDSPVVSPPSPVQTAAEYRLFKIEISLMVHFSIIWLQKSKLNIEALSKGLCKLSDSDYPRVITNICVVANTVKE